MAKHPHSGFTLVELSIVLLIFGLSAGAILKGYELVANAQSRSLMAQIDAYRAATNAFVDKYGQYPGDFDQASVMLPPKPGNGAPQVDGDGNGRVDGLGNEGESLEFWQHLAAAGLIAGINGTSPVPGVGIPVGRRPGSAWNVLNADSDGGQMCDGCTVTGNYWRLGAPNPNSLTSHALVPAADSYLLDVKVDDGHPLTGLVQARDGDGVDPGDCIGPRGYATSSANSGSPSCVLAFVF